MKEKALYFIAIIPGKHIIEKVNEIKNDFRQRFNSSHSLKSPPHITLQMPFRFDEQQEYKIVNALQGISNKIKSLEIDIDGFGSFPPRVIYLKVKENSGLWNLWKEVTENLRKNLGIDNSTYRNKGFTPHITVAFRDLKKPDFYSAWKEYESKSFKATFKSQHIWILKHEKGIWNQHEEC